MKKKYSLLVLSLILAMFLSGCVIGIIIPATDEAKVKNVINEYFLAINDQNWNKAKSCCVYGSDIYYETYFLENRINTLYQYASNVTITCLMNISNVSVNGSYASAYCSGSITIIADYYYESDSASGYCYLQKVGNNWKIYDF